jgi:hypothetical protein
MICRYKIILALMFLQKHTKYQALYDDMMKYGRESKRRRG